MFESNVMYTVDDVKSQYTMLAQQALRRAQRLRGSYARYWTSKAKLYATWAGDITILEEANKLHSDSVQTHKIIPINRRII